MKKTFLTVAVLSALLAGQAQVLKTNIIEAPTISITNIFPTIPGTLQPVVNAFLGATAIQFDAMPTYDGHYWGGLLDVDVPIPGTDMATNIVGSTPWTAVGLEFGYMNHSFNYGAVNATFGPTFTLGPILLHPYTLAAPLYAFNVKSGQSTSAGVEAAVGADFVVPLSAKFAFRVGGRMMTFSNNPKPSYALPIGFNWQF